LSAAARLYLFLIGGGGSKFKKFFRLSAAAGKFKNEKFFRK
jgi:hypothetical protein